MEKRGDHCRVVYYNMMMCAAVELVCLFQQSTLKKLAINPIQGIEEVNMIKDDGHVLHFTNPKGMCVRVCEHVCVWGGGVCKLGGSCQFTPCFSKYTVQASLTANTFAITGTPEEKRKYHLLAFMCSRKVYFNNSSDRDAPWNLQPASGGKANFSLLPSHSLFIVYLSCAHTSTLSSVKYYMLSSVSS